MLGLIIDYKRHASKRLIMRSCDLGLNFDDALKRVKETIYKGRLSRTKRSKQNVIYYKYFADNISFFVICKKFTNRVVVKTVILRKGRE